MFQPLDPNDGLRRPPAPAVTPQRFHPHGVLHRYEVAKQGAPPLVRVVVPRRSGRRVGPGPLFLPLWKLRLVGDPCRLKAHEPRVQSPPVLRFTRPVAYAVGRGSVFVVQRDAHVG